MKTIKTIYMHILDLAYIYFGISSTAGCTLAGPVRCLVSPNSCEAPYNFFANKSGYFSRPCPGYARDFSSSNGEGITDSEFNQWFTGFTDGEGHFFISISPSNVISFAFKIKLHIDDLGVLEFIKNRLNCGTIIVGKDNSAQFYLTKIRDISTILIPLFEKFPLNGIKYLDYLCFKEGVSLKLNGSIPKDEQFRRIASLKISMNTQRVNFEMPDSHTIRITPYWLLGLIEGEGTFCLNDPKTMGISFSFALTASQAPLIYAIKSYLDTQFVTDPLLKSSPFYLEISSKLSYISIKNSKKVNIKPAIELAVRQVNFIVDKLIPMFSNLTFLTKKHLDFLDWQIIASLIYTGKHTTEEGRELIIKISQRMNNYRLSTFKQGATKLKDSIDKSLWNKVLNMEDIYIRDSRGLRIIAANRSLVKGQLFYLLAEGPHEEQNLFFQDSKACAEYFGVTSQTINDRLAKELPILDPSTRIEFRLSRRPVISRGETFKKG